MNFKNIRDLRENSNFTQQYIADYLKINRVVYSRYELGNRQIPVFYLINLSKLYNTSIDYIVGITNKKDINY